jgi:hypothetical protein
MKPVRLACGLHATRSDRALRDGGLSPLLTTVPSSARSIGAGAARRPSDDERGSCDPQ